jgi:hypothetical protein
MGPDMGETGPDSSVVVIDIRSLAEELQQIKHEYEIRTKKSE